MLHSVWSMARKWGGNLEETTQNRDKAELLVRQVPFAHAAELYY
jgi:hypothetical protein